MLKLYYAPGACSQAVHIVLHEAGLDHNSELVDLRAKLTATGADYWAINPKGSVPALDLGNGEILTENAAILQYLGDVSDDEVLLPPVGQSPAIGCSNGSTSSPPSCTRVLARCGIPAASIDSKEGARDLLAKKFAYAEQRLGAGPFLLGERLTIADPYLFVIANWTGLHGIDIGRWPGLVAFVERMRTRPAVDTVLRAEGLVEEEVAG